MHADDKELFAALVLAIISRRDSMRKFKGIYFYINNSRVEKTQDYGNDFQILQNLIIISANKGYTKDDILNCYWKKWQKNMARIGKEWN